MDETIRKGQRNILQHCPQCGFDLEKGLDQNLRENEKCFDELEKKRKEMELIDGKGKEEEEDDDDNERRIMEENNAGNKIDKGENEGIGSDDEIVRNEEDDRMMMSKAEKSMNIDNEDVIIEITTPRHGDGHDSDDNSDDDSDNDNMLEEVGKVAAIFKVFGRSGVYIKKRDKRKNNKVENSNENDDDQDDEDGSDNDDECDNKDLKKKKKKKKKEKKKEISIVSSIGIHRKSKRWYGGKTSRKKITNDVSTTCMSDDEFGENELVVVGDHVDKLNGKNCNIGEERIVSLAHDDFIEYSVRKNKKNKKKDSAVFLHRTRKKSGKAGGGRREGEKTRRKSNESSFSSVEDLTRVNGIDEKGGRMKSNDSDIQNKDGVEVISFAHDDFIEYRAAADNHRNKKNGVNGAGARAFYRLIRVEPNER